VLVQYHECFGDEAGSGIASIDGVERRERQHVQNAAVAGANRAVQQRYARKNATECK
jgi:hypothetical protein